MSLSIDWKFIGDLEGRQLTGYVPDAKGSESGVTIGVGIDLGQESTDSLAGLSVDLIAKLSPYLGLKGQAAIDALAATPLVLTDAEADELDSFIDDAEVKTLVAKYDVVSAVLFADLDARAQTVIASVHFQYGDLSVKAPKFWDRVINQDWSGAYHELMNFGDSYPTRRRKEAAYIWPLVETAPVA